MYKILKIQCFQGSVTKFIAFSRRLMFCAQMHADLWRRKEKMEEYNSAGILIKKGNYVEARSGWWPSALRENFTFGLINKYHFY